MRLAKIYALIYVFIRRFFNFNLPGLGFFLRRINSSSIINFRGRKMYFNHKVSSSYGLHIIDLPQENETHLFLDYLLSDFEDDFSFVDIGANIGAFLIDVSRKHNAHLYGFDPFPECVVAIEKSLKLNGVENYNLYNNLVGDKEAEVLFDLSIDPEGASVRKQKKSKNQVLLKQVKLDDILNIESPSIWLIDVEGYEPNVIIGAKNLINKVKPLIIFEYNEQISKKHFTISDIKSLIGSDYKCYRLRNDGRLDSEVENAWNCVAIPSEHVFSDKLRNIILHS